MKKFLLSCALGVVSANLAAQSMALNYSYDYEAKTATVIQDKRWHENDDGTGGFWYNMYEGDIIIPSQTPDGYTVVAIGDQAFARLTTNENERSITSVVIPNTVKTIGDQAFYSCYRLSSVTIPASVESIGEMVFNSSGIKTLTIEDGDTPITIGGSGSVVGSVLNSAQNCTSVYVGRNINYANDSQTTFGFSGFLTDLTYGPKVTRIMAKECWRSPSIQRITFLGEELEEIPEDAFAECTALISITLPDKVSVIGKSAFKECKVLQDISLPAHVTTISDEAFRGCHALASLSIPATVTTVGFGALMSSGIKMLRFEDGDATLTLGEDIFSYNSGMTVYDGRPLETTASNNRLFEFNSAIIDFTYGPLTRSIHPSEWHSSQLQRLTINSDYITVIPKEAFFDCRSLQAATLHTQLLTIDESAFNDCSSLASVSIPQGCQLQTIGDWAFCNAPLTSFPMPDGVTSIGRGAFLRCQLTSIKIPAGVTTIDGRAFEGNSTMKTIYAFPVKPVSIEADVFNNVDKNTCKLYVPQGSYEAYKAAPVWKDFFLTEEGLETGIADILCKQPGVWYSVEGRRLSTKPDKPGLYIFGGKKYGVK